MKVNNTERLLTIDALRGLASFSVCWFHLTNGTPTFLQDGYLKSSGAYGWVGVEVFFVISGFIIPFTLWQSDYSMRSYGRFILKRVVRLDPPYLLSILLVIALAYASLLYPDFRGKSPSYSLPQILLHLGFLNVFFGYPWINIIYWSLALEFQYYLLIGLIFPLLVSNKIVVRFGTVLFLWLVSYWWSNERFVFAWLPLFLLGVIAFYYKVGLLGNGGLVVGIALFTIYTYLMVGVVIATVVLLASILILFVEIKSRLLKLLGEISYSLYLVHVPIGGRIINLSLRYADSTLEKVISLLVALAVSLCAAYLFYRAIELPSRKWSSEIRYEAK